jgi:hypothetical protein
MSGIGATQPPKKLLQKKLKRESSSQLKSVTKEGDKEEKKG